jgi:hypothetical protein
MSVAALAPRFVDEECWRFTPAGIRATLSLYSSVEVVAETSSLGGLLRTANLGLHSVARGRLLRRLHEITLCPCLNLLGDGSGESEADEERPVHAELQCAGD